jgi:hypothetical protein
MDIILSRENGVLQTRKREEDSVKLHQRRVSLPYTSFNPAQLSVRISFLPFARIHLALHRLGRWASQRRGSRGSGEGKRRKRKKKKRGTVVRILSLPAVIQRKVVFADRSVPQGILAPPNVVTNKNSPEHPSPLGVECRTSGFLSGALLGHAMCVSCRDCVRNKVRRTR